MAGCCRGWELRSYLIELLSRHFPAGLSLKSIQARHSHDCSIATPPASSPVNLVASEDFKLLHTHHRLRVKVRRHFIWNGAT